jgi:hypothetical protein
VRKGISTSKLRASQASQIHAANKSQTDMSETEKNDITSRQSANNDKDSNNIEASSQ